MTQVDPGIELLLQECAHLATQLAFLGVPHGASRVATDAESLLD